MRAWNRPDEYQYDYVQDADPTTETTVDEGETWYDTGAGAAFVYNGASWVDMTVSDHSQLTGVNADTHHNRYTDSEARNAVDNSNVSVGDADTVDGSHASDFAPSPTTKSITGSTLELSDKSPVFGHIGSITWDNSSSSSFDVVFYTPDGNITKTVGGYTTDTVQVDSYVMYMDIGKFVPITDMTTKVVR